MVLSTKGLDEISYISFPETGYEKNILQVPRGSNVKHIAMSDSPIIH